MIGGTKLWNDATAGVDDGLRYDDMGNPNIVKFVPSGARVLDVGCSTGRRSEWLRGERGCSVVGIEVDTAMAQLAKDRCDSLIVADLDNLQELPFTEGFFDLIIFGDVLEHLRNPEQVLVKMLFYLRPSGTVLISIPNFVFFDVRVKVLLGKFRYQSSGILDSTHLHFYTRNTLREMANRCGLDIKGWDFTPPYYGVLWRRVPLSIRTALARTWPGLFATQFVIECIPSNVFC